jgi:DHA2 family multidrug resistance protein
VANLAGSNPVLMARLGSLGRYLHEQGAGTYAATRQAYAQIYGLVQQQAAVLSYVDAFWILAMACLMVVPIIFVARRPEAGRAAMGH